MSASQFENMDTLVIRIVIIPIDVNCLNEQLRSSAE